jgi:ribosomal-protein-alanine N-acetyltransferase
MDLDAFFAEFPRLETPRLALRRLTPADAGDAAAFFGDPEVGRHTVWWGQVARHGLAGFLAQLERDMVAREFAVWGIVPKEVGRVCGFVGLVPITAAHDRAELGYALARPCWGRGYALEAARAAVDCAFARLRPHRLEAYTSVENAASGRILDRLGFRREGVLRGYAVIRGVPRDRAIHALLSQEWSQGKARATAE